LDADGIAGKRRASHRDRISGAWICRLAGGDSWAGGRRLPGKTTAGVSPMGSGLPHSLVCVAVADVSADGNACHADERIAAVC
jgi:hypothetical protein